MRMVQLCNCSPWISYPLIITRDIWMLIQSSQRKCKSSRKNEPCGWHQMWKVDTKKIPSGPSALPSSVVPSNPKPHLAPWQTSAARPLLKSICPTQNSTKIYQDIPRSTNPSLHCRDTEVLSPFLVTAGYEWKLSKLSKLSTRRKQVPGLARRTSKTLCPVTPVVKTCQDMIRKEGFP